MPLEGQFSRASHSGSRIPVRRGSLGYTAAMASKGKAQEGLIQIPLVWVDLDATEIAYANMILVQQGEGKEFFLAFGQVGPPVLPSEDPETNRAALAGISFLPVRTVVRLGTTLERLEQFTESMQKVLSGYRAQESRATISTRAERRRRG